MSKISRMRIADSFKFSEEIIQLVDSIDPRTKDEVFDIQFERKKTCQISETNPRIGNSNICKYCYYREFAEKLVHIRKSKRTAFVEYQLSLRKNKPDFLQELKEFITDHEDDIDESDYGISFAYLNIIEGIENESNSISSKSFVKVQERDAELLGGRESYNLDVFISHSSLDVIVVRHLVDLIISAFHIRSERIRCTSVPGFMLKGGANSDEQLREEIFKSRVFIGLVTEQSLSSHYVLFEFGARWGQKMKLIPLVKSEKDYKIMKAPLNSYHAINLSNAAQVHQLISQLEEELGLKSEAPAVYNVKLEALISSINIAV